MTYNVFSGTLNPTQSINLCCDVIIFSNGCAYTSGSRIIYIREQHAAENDILQQYAACSLMMH